MIENIINKIKDENKCESLTLICSQSSIVENVSIIKFIIDRLNGRISIDVLFLLIVETKQNL